nr:hypothetical protein [Mycobacterium lepromatosis]
MVVDLLLKRAVSLGVPVCYDRCHCAYCERCGLEARLNGVMWKRFVESGAVKVTVVVIAVGRLVMNPENGG